MWPLEREPTAAFMIWLLVHEWGKGGRPSKVAKSGDVPVLPSSRPKPHLYCVGSQPPTASSSRSHCLGSALPGQSGGLVLPRAPMVVVVVIVMKRMARCGRWAASPCRENLDWGGRGLFTCSYACPSAGAAPPGAGPGSSHRHWWGLSLAPEPPVVPGNGFSGMGCRCAPLPGWMGTAR